VAPAAAQHRPLARAARALVERVEVAAQPHHGPERLQRLWAPLAAAQPAAGGDHVARLDREKPDRLLPEGPKAGLAALGEDLGNRSAFAGGDHVVGLDEAAAQTPGQ